MVDGAHPSSTSFEIKKSSMNDEKLCPIIVHVTSR